MAAPELCGFEGRSVYLECDQLLLGDIGELFTQDLGEHAMAMVSTTDARNPSFRRAGRGFLPGVVLFDNARCRALDLAAVSRAAAEDRLLYDGTVSGGERFSAFTGLDVGSLPPRFNDMEQRHDDTVVLHYTRWHHRRWKNTGCESSDVWFRELAQCIIDGHVTTEMLDQALALGEISRRCRTSTRLPARAIPVADRFLQRVEVARQRLLARRS
ncbi:MAG: hypothetical protein AB8G14_07515 [Ilumatobacter sp.]